MTSSSIFFDVVVFLLSSLVTCTSFMSISWLVLKNWPEIRKLEISPSMFCPIPGDWRKLWIPNLAQMSLMKCYWLIQNAKVKTLTVSELLRENLLKYKQSANDKNFWQCGHIVLQSLYPRSQCQLGYLRLLMSRTNILELHITNLPLHSFPWQHLQKTSIKPFNQSNQQIKQTNQSNYFLRVRGWSPASYTTLSLPK